MGINTYISRKRKVSYFGGEVTWETDFQDWSPHRASLEISLWGRDLQVWFKDVNVKCRNEEPNGALYGSYLILIWLSWLIQPFGLRWRKLYPMPPSWKLSPKAAPGELEDSNSIWGSWVPAPSRPSKSRDPDGVLGTWCQPNWARHCGIWGVIHQKENGSLCHPLCHSVFQEIKID